MRSRRLAWAMVLWATLPAQAETGGAFRDWALSCTVGLRCTASTYPSDGAALSALGIERTAGEDAHPSLRLTLGDGTKLTGAVRLRIDDGETVALPVAAFHFDENGNADTADPRVATDLLPPMLQGRAITVVAETDAGAREQRFSLAGIVASLRKMDDDQRRVGTRSALIDKGDEPLPDRGSLPTDIVTADDLPPGVRSLWQADGGCADFGDTGPVSDLGFSIPSGPEIRLFVLACGLPGAYNYPSHVYRHYPGSDTAEPLPVPFMTADGPAADLDIWNVDFSGDRLTSFFKGRGIGDCGRYGAWRVENETGQLVLLEAREKEDCDGNPGGGAETWPLLWPKR